MWWNSAQVARKSTICTSQKPKMAFMTPTGPSPSAAAPSQSTISSVPKYIAMPVPRWMMELAIVSVKR